MPDFGLTCRFTELRARRILCAHRSCVAGTSFASFWAYMHVNLLNYDRNRERLGGIEEGVACPR